MIHFIYQDILNHNLNTSIYRYRQSIFVYSLSINAKNLSSRNWVDRITF